MGTHVIKMPDVGEGIAEAELVEWHVGPGDFVKEDEVLAAVMTDKATVEIPSVVNGTVLWLGAEIGEQVAIGSQLIHIEVDGPGNYNGPPLSLGEKPDGALASAPKNTEEKSVQSPAEPASAKPRAEAESIPAKSAVKPQSKSAPARNGFGRPIASPAVRKLARDAGIDLRRVAGTGTAGRITREDIEAHQSNPVVTNGGPTRHRNTSIEEIKVVGLRRKISERMAAANTHIPHITIVEEVDVTALEELRKGLNIDHAAARGKLTILPFIMKAIVHGVAAQPGLNAHFLDDDGIIRQFGGVHIGIATQTPNGLMVPVARHAEAMGVWDAAKEVARIAGAARDGSATRDELSGSTISISSLGPLGAIATTPIINRPEVAIIGVNKIAIRPVWINGEFVPRQIMNISCSFDHRVVDGWDAAVFVQKLKTLLEAPAMMFVEQ